MTREVLIGTLQRAPGGLRSDEVAALMPDVRPGRVGAELSRLATYGLISREYRRGTDNGMHRRWCIWKAKEATRA